MRQQPFGMGADFERNHRKLQITYIFIHRKANCIVGPIDDLLRWKYRSSMDHMKLFIGINDPWRPSLNAPRLTSAARKGKTGGKFEINVHIMDKITINMTGEDPLKSRLTEKS